MTHIESHVDLQRIVDRRDRDTLMVKFAAVMATVATCVLTITMVLGSVGEISGAGSKEAGARAQARTVAGDTPYFPAQYKLDAPDEMPTHIETF